MGVIGDFMAQSIRVLQSNRWKAEPSIWISAGAAVCDINDDLSHKLCVSMYKNKIYTKDRFAIMHVIRAVPIYLFKKRVNNNIKEI